ncbi:oxidoreductase [Labedella phragmitis]|uniref:Oxidoreductase n=1 Tax=Labedella phragmitis TaxID=2498849 RepID=A0A3S4BGX0_9MICO|nr:NAD(P)-dependent oxidoreductase [Labedella phragmitis]RWZ49813.1 oxidoreductase [Labedella phragmitis]
MTRRILVTPRSVTAAGLESVIELQPLRDAGFELVSGPAGTTPTAADLADVPHDIVGWLAGVERIGPAEMDLLPALRVISRNGAGADAIDAAAAAARGIEVLTARGANARGVAELALSHMLAGVRGTVPSHDALRRGEWFRTPGREFPDLTVGVVGYGAIGRLSAAFARGLDARVLVSDPFAVSDRPDVESVELGDLFARADVVTLHAPPPADGTPLLDRRRIALLPPRAVVVNTARWSLVDPTAMLDALESGAVSCYAVDAFAEEPPAPHPLLEHPNVILSAHLGGYTDASVRRAVEGAVAGLLSTLGSR